MRELLVNRLGGNGHIDIDGTGGERSIRLSARYTGMAIIAVCRRVGGGVFFEWNQHFDEQFCASHISMKTPWINMIPEWNIIHFLLSRAPLFQNKIWSAQSESAFLHWISQCRRYSPSCTMKINLLSNYRCTIGYSEGSPTSTLARFHLKLGGD